MSDVNDWFERLLAAAADQTAAVHAAYQQLDNAGLIGRVTVHSYLCRRCGPRATVIRVGGRTLARTKDYKFSPGMNEARSVEEARSRNTLDGKRHWPGHTFDVDELAKWGDGAGFDIVCRHVATTVMAVDVLAATRDVLPGHPGKPTILGGVSPA